MARILPVPGSTVTAAVPTPLGSPIGTLLLTASIAAIWILLSRVVRIFRPPRLSVLDRSVSVWPRALKPESLMIMLRTYEQK